MQKQKSIFSKWFPISLIDSITTVVIFALAWGTCMLLHRASPSDGFASPVFVLAVLLVSRLTTGYLYGLLASVLGVVCVNYIFTYPYFEFNFTITGYPITFLTMFAVSTVVGMLTEQVKRQSRIESEAAKAKINASLRQNFYYHTREWPYKNVKPRIIAEAYMEDSKTAELRDYKFFCFDGVVKALFVATERQKAGEEVKSETVFTFETVKD